MFAGKAHPADEPGRALIRRVHEVACMPEFEGNVLLVEGYDLRLGRRLVQGVDVWLNNPIYPLEASGTSGIKAAVNGVLNLSELDGWWDEGYDGSNGWAIKPVHDGLDEAERARDESRTLYEILQDKVIPLYYERGPLGYSPGWIAMAKRSMASIAPRFNAARMIGQYVSKFYMPASQHWQAYSRDGFALAHAVASWKERVRSRWGGVSLRRLGEPPRRLHYGEGARFEIAVGLNGLEPDDMAVEMVLSRLGMFGVEEEVAQFRLEPVRALDHGEHLYGIDLSPEWCGKMQYRFRAYPHIAHLTHRFEMGLMCWL